MAKRRRTLMTSWLAAGLTLTLVVNTAGAGAVPSQSDQKIAKATPHPQALDEPTPVRSVVPTPRNQQSPTAKSQPAMPVVWPAAGVTTLSAAKAGAAMAGRAGGLPVRVKAVGGAASVRVEVMDRSATAKSGVDGVLLRVRRTDGSAATKVGLDVDYSAFGKAYGGDWGSRLRLRRLSDGAVLGRNDVRGQRVTADVQVAAADSLYAVTAAPNGSSGSFTATPLALSGSWSASGQTGEFSWGYPFKMPETPGGLEPQLSLSYSSGAVDGRTASTNNQPSWVGEGFDLWSGYIERSYRSCNDDKTGSSATEETGDQCWFSDNATLSLGGHSGPLVRVGSTDTFRLKNDDGSRIERLRGADNGDNDKEYWRVSTSDGTQYYFGRNRLPHWSADQQTNSTWLTPVFGNHKDEPCENGAYAASWCQQAYRWNLDHVVDRHGNTITYYYEKERNNYGLNRGRTTVGYDRGGVLVRAEFGTRLGAETPGQAPASVVFGNGPRCVNGAACATQNRANYPDVPFDQNCASNCTTLISPTFWTTKRLTSVTTRAGSTDIQRWNLRHSFPDPQDGTSAGLWLAGLQQEGLTGTRISLPEITFGGEPRENRVNADNDVAFPLVKFRVDEIVNEYGGVIAVTYAPANCSPGTLPKVPAENTLRCYPVHWQPDGGQPFDDWFHKYVVSSVAQQDPITGSPTESTTYEYVGGGAWGYVDNELVTPERRTWSEWRGYQRVVEVHGDPGDTATKRGKKETLYYRGMNGERLANGGKRDATFTDSSGEVVRDEPWLNGRVREQLTYRDLEGPVIGSTITVPWVKGPTTTQGTLQAYQVQEGVVRERTALTGGSWRRTEITRDYHDNGELRSIDDRGDLATTADDECTTTTYAQDPAGRLTTLPAQVRTVNKPCGAAYTSGDVISDVQTLYDGAAHGTVGAKGNATAVRNLSGHAADGTAQYVTATRTTYDSYGRPVETLDALDARTTTQYTETAGLTTKITTTNPLGHQTVTELTPLWGEPVAAIDTAGGRTDVTYDALGRVSGVWLPGRSAANGAGPNLRYSYQIRNTAVSAVATETLRAGGNYVTSYSLYDSFLRVRQTQSPGWGQNGTVEGRVVSETGYNSRGMVARQSGQFYAAGAPGADLVEAGENNLPSHTDTEYDGTGRVVASVFKSKNVEQWRTTTEYLGDRVKVTPPAGGTATTTISNADGKTVELQQHRGATPDGPAEITRYTYAPGGQLATLTDPAGNMWRYEYDAQGRQIRSHDPDKGETRLAYDAAGRLITTTDARGRTLAYGYDAIGRRTAEHEGSLTGPVRATWTYDSIKPGLPTSSSRTDGGVTYTSAVVGYDVAGRPTSTRLTIPAAASTTGVAGNYETKYTYRADGSPDTLILPRVGDLPEETLSYGYDALGLSRTLRAGTTQYVADTWYTRFGELAHVAMGAPGSMLWNSLYYESATRRLERTLVERESTAQAEVNDFQYRYDPVGNMTRIADLPDGGPQDRQCFQYDHLRRTTEAWSATTDECGATPQAGGASAYWTSYRYDAVGNRTSEVQHGIGGVADTTRTYSHPAAGEARPHGVQSVTTTGPTGSRVDTFGYDATGNTTTRTLAGDTQQLSWDTAGRLVSSTSADGKTTTLGYDADGERLIRRDPTSTTLYLAGQELRYDHVTKAKTATRFYAHGGSTIAVRTAAGVFWQAGDHHGTATTSVAAGSLVVTRRQFTPFGDVRGAAAAWPSERGFVGGTKDESLGLLRLGAREYDPSTGRFLSVDPVIDPSDPQQLNAYGYANSNPASMSDPDGLRYFVDVDGRVSIPSLKYATQKQIKRATAQAKKITQVNQKVKRDLDRKIRASGHTPKEYEEAKEIKRKSVIDVVIEAGGEVLKEFLGINDIKGCFGDGDLGACIAMVVNVIPWSKLFRVGELIGAVKKAWNAVTNFFEKRRAADRLLADVAKAEPPNTPATGVKDGMDPTEVADDIKERTTDRAQYAKGAKETLSSMQTGKTSSIVEVPVSNPPPVTQAVDGLHAVIVGGSLTLALVGQRISQGVRKLFGK